MKYSDKESNILELKREYSNSILKTISAFSNYDGGKIVIGVDDDRNIVGIDNIKDLKISIENKINNSIEPRPLIEFNERRHNGFTVLEIVVIRGFFTPYLYNGKAYMRKDTSTVQVDHHEFVRLATEGRSYSYDEVNASNQNLIFTTLEKILINRKNIEKLNKDILITLELINNDDIFNNAGELLSDNNQIKSSGIDIIRFNGNDVSSYINRHESTKKSVLSQLEDVENLFDKYYPHVEEIKGMYREKVEQVPKSAFREAIVNALIHRDYHERGQIQVSFFDNRVEILSPGALPKEISEKDYIYGIRSVSRNPILANVFKILDLIEKFGTGIKKMRDSYSNSHHNPVFLIEPKSVTVILPNLLYDDSKFDDKSKIINYFSINKKATREDIENKFKLNKTSAINILNELIKENIIRREGESINIVYIYN